MHWSLVSKGASSSETGLNRDRAEIWAQRDIPRRHKFMYDLLYLKKQSLWFDLRLIVLSFWITFRGKWEAPGKNCRRNPRHPAWVQASLPNPRACQCFPMAQQR